MKRFLTYLILQLTWATPVLSQIGIDQDPHTVDSILSVAIHALDSVEAKERLAQYQEQFIDEYQKRGIARERKLDLDGSPHLIRGLLLTYTDRHFRNHEGVFKKHDRSWGQYGIAIVPLATSWAMKAFGLKSKSSAERMLMSNSMALAISSSITFGLKESAREMRPDGSKRNSLPSGHSSLAFTAATILHREYGHLSPWISVGGYATATGVQLLRIHDNAHWVHDTFIGAGIGMLSTNIAYFLTDQALHGRGINAPRQTMGDLYRQMAFIEHPNSITMVTCIETGSNKILPESYELLTDFSGQIHFKTGATYSAGVEGSFFFNKHIGLEAIARFASVQAKAEAVSLTSPMPQLYGTNIDYYHTDLGIKASTALTDFFRISGRVYGGARFVDSAPIREVEGGSTFARIKSEQCAEFGGGIAVDFFKESKKFMYGFYVDYNHACSKLFENRWCIGSTWRIGL